MNESHGRRGILSWNAAAISQARTDNGFVVCGQLGNGIYVCVVCAGTGWGADSWMVLWRRLQGGPGLHHVSDNTAESGG